jgi:uncharacterized lipoprotein YajG
MKLALLLALLLMLDACQNPSRLQATHSPMPQPKMVIGSS